MGAGVRLSEFRQFSNREAHSQLSDLDIERRRKRLGRFRIWRFATFNPLDCSQSNT